ncbi:MULTISPECIES: hypothetical protein [unclassified Leptolyngbya]|uniref:hypothetical protein n=1 Tax=unclassified Leptolyngbya TaxID=2650499 RepID=UPI001685DCA5|nr:MULTISPECIES: hypothetical protein [unclassified Leptolyngbya]MBD1910161.1 hypothetical protein [Leptolyngbya sp. FACHB-8]MBD2153593.1 hypothetical protein [Leptolyngbya sp. FACHB-16]
MKQVDELAFPNGHQAKTIRIHRNSDVLTSLKQLGLHPPSSTLVLVGGASGISPEAMEQLRSLFCNTLAPLAERLGLTVVDGGTDSGVMQLMGHARQHIQGSFPLLGVVAHAMVAFPDQPAPPDGAPLEPHHTHFMMVPGALWGDEAPWIAKVATVLSGARPSLTVLVNGGMIAWQDVDNSLRENRPVLVMSGSGRTADVLAAALAGDRSNDRANRLVESGLMEAIDLAAPPENLQQVFEAHLNPAMPISQ